MRLFGGFGGTSAPIWDLRPGLQFFSIIFSNETKKNKIIKRLGLGLGTETWDLGPGTWDLGPGTWDLGPRT